MTIKPNNFFWTAFWSVNLSITGILLFFVLNLVSLYLPENIWGDIIFFTIPIALIILGNRSWHWYKNLTPEMNLLYLSNQSGFYGALIFGLISFIYISYCLIGSTDGLAMLAYFYICPVMLMGYAMGLILNLLIGRQK